MPGEGLPQRGAGQRRKRRLPDQDADDGNRDPDGGHEGFTDGGPGRPESMPDPAQLDALRSQAAEGHSFEYLDHTADVQLHAWGSNLQEAFANVALAMYNYMVPIEQFNEDELDDREFTAEAHDAESLLFKFLDELLFSFLTELFVCTSVTVTSLDRKAWTITAKGRGSTFDRGKHLQGTEVKAITYSAMQIIEREGDAEVFVIVDI